jgi:hypothetical protein
MKKFIALLTLTLVTTLSFGAETEKVCIDKMTKDGKPVLDKAGKPQQECKTIKVHKKLEGTKVPEKSEKK